MASIISRTEFARMAGVPVSSISNSLKAKGGFLRPAKVGDRIDADHPAADAYLKKRRAMNPDGVATEGVRTNGKPKKKATKKGDSRGRKKKSASKGDDKPVLITRDVESFRFMTLDELEKRFPTRTALKDFLDAMKKVEDIASARLSNEAKRGDLIARETVRIHVFGALEGGSRRLLQDLPRTATQRMVSMIKSGSEVVEVERVLRTLIAGVLTKMKKDVQKGLRKKPEKVK